MRRLANIPGISFAIFFAWKLALLLFTSQPVPSNDAFFYDGPVVNYLLHGKYCNPSLAKVLPISGNEVFCAYPPLYQAVLLGWMKCFGTSAVAAMWLHVTLLGIFMVTVWKIFQQLQVPALAANLAGLFLFGLTFHDRPDTLAEALGALAILAMARGMIWPAAVFLLLTFCTSLQIGGIYLLWIALLTMGSVWLAKSKFPWAASLVFAAALFALILLVKFGYPHLWEGFREHVSITPSFTGLRLPQVDDLLKIIRTAPGILLVLVGLAVLLASRSGIRDQLGRSPQMVMAICGALVALALVGGCLFILTPNTIHIAGYLQPVIVGCYLAALADGFGRLGGETAGCKTSARDKLPSPLRKGRGRGEGFHESPPINCSLPLTPALSPSAGERENFSAGSRFCRPAQALLGKFYKTAWGFFILAALLVSIRAIGMTTWGVVCAGDVSRAQAERRVNAELDALPPSSTVLVSSAYLYEAARRTNVTWLHSDWPAIWAPGPWELNTWVKLRPAKMILTQFDFYRREQATLNALRAQLEVAEVRITDTARIPAPDASPTTQKVVQHISWAPVIVDFIWRSEESTLPKPAP